MQWSTHNIFFIKQFVFAEDSKIYICNFQEKVSILLETNSFKGQYYKDKSGDVHERHKIGSTKTLWE